MDYKTLLKLWERKRKDLDYKKLGYKLQLENLDDCFGIRLHSTIILEFYPDGEVKVTCPEYWITTRLSKTTINNCLPKYWWIVQQEGYIYLRYYPPPKPFSKTWVFYPEITINKKHDGIVRRKFRR